MLSHCGAGHSVSRHLQTAIVAVLTYFSSCRWFIHPLPDSSAEATSAGRGAAGSHPAARADTAFPGPTGAAGSGKAAAVPPRARADADPWQGSYVTRTDATFQRLRSIRSFSGISLPFSPHSLRYKTFTLLDLAKLNQINIQLCVKFLFFFFFLLSRIRGVVLNNSYQFITF